jgi:Carboxypeptidase regulatory-like domain/TonB dependent receptor/TonB-dependent Receptor Plug Domain
MVRVALLVMLFVLLMLPTSARASTTGTLRGHVRASGTGAPLAGAVVVATSPSQVERTTSDASGSFAFIALAPDTYTVSASKSGYDSTLQPGVIVLADQSATVSLTLTEAFATIARTTSRSSASLVHPGVTSDVYSVDSAQAQAASALSGADSLTQAYGAISSAPGVSIPTNQQGWYQTLYIRGGDYSQVAYEFDGLPMTRQSDLAPIGTLSALGNQEVQVYTGGTPATSNSAGLAGYVSQVLKTGTYPGYATANLGIGGPAFYHSATIEVGGATPDRLFSYYAGFGGTDQTFRFGDQFGGVSDPLYFYPFYVPTSNTLYNLDNGSCAIGPRPSCSAPSYGFVGAPGYSYEQAANFDRENIVNLHFGIPHKNSPYKDDVQLMWAEGGIVDQIYSSQNDIGFTPAVSAATGIPYPLRYLTSYVYTGALMQAPKATNLATQLYPSSSSQTPGTAIASNDRDGNYNGFSIEKLQYQRNFGSRSYLRAVGYGEYTAWFINGPNSAVIPLGATPPDFEYIGHVFGANATYSNQISASNLLTAEASASTQKLQTYNALPSSTDPLTANLEPTGLGTVLSNYGTPNGRCFNYETGQPWSCFSAGSQGGCLSASPCYADGSGSEIDLTPGYAPAGSPAAKAGAHWMVTENGAAAQISDVATDFSSVALTDVWQPNDRLVVNAGMRLDRFAYLAPDLESGYPARQFWFDAYNDEHCGKLGEAPQYTWNGSAFVGCPSGYLPFNDPGVGLFDSAAANFVSDVLQPRLSFTYSVDPETVIRGSYGKYARAEGSSYYQYDTLQQNLPSFLAQFYRYGYHTPDHDISPDTSNNLDLSLERRVKGTELSYKLTPFYRNTQNQLQFQTINAVEGIYAGLNVGQQQSYGVELSTQYGNFAEDGFSALAAYTHTQSSIRFDPINGVSVLDALNQQIELYNSYTAGCAAVTRRSPNWAACGSGAFSGNALQRLPYQPASPQEASTIPNPYYHDPLQPLLDTSAQYAPYDLIPSPFSGANGYEVPDVATLVLNYRRSKLAITPSLRFDDGSNYGSPLVWPGYVPQSCTAPPPRTPRTPGATCNGRLPNGQSIGAIFLPDPYTGKFDDLGAFVQPSELSVDLQTSYQLSPNVTLTVEAVNLYNRCFQRGYPWDNSLTCEYSDLPSEILAPSGNFIKNPPLQLRYPYGTYFNCSGAGYSAILQPFGFFADVGLRF